MTRLASLVPIVVTVMVVSPVPRDVSLAVGDPSQELYEIACAKCHGLDGKGVDATQVAFTAETPDFTDCSFSSREPDADWIAVAHQGGPVRAFDPTMPAFGEALTEEQLQSVMDYIRGFCSDPRWPRGELNLPRPFLTEKAYPEDEAVLTGSVNAEGPGAISQAIVYEKRFGPVNQLEIKVPFAVRNSGATAASDWGAGIGDIEVGLKRVLHHDLEGGTILSLGGEVVLPTGDDSRGYGKGYVVAEPFLSFGQILPSDAFLHLQGIVELPFEGGRDTEVVLRGAVGRSYTQGEWGRTWTPMLEWQAGKALEGGSDLELDVIPQVQVTLNTRQHVIGNIGLQVPVTQTGSRTTQLLVYILWDWFDGGLFDGW